ncbi:hypothetical protein BDZ89DRAFT_1073529 [Hymenopellis radicata]|nr:hypothetical protein BDZ89DRAFT_1073529 [Hymenopellis radicata]
MYSARNPVAGGGPNTSGYGECGSATVGAWYPDASVVAKQASLGGEYAYAPGTALDAASSDVMPDTISSPINDFSTLPTDPGGYGHSGLRGSGISPLESLAVSTAFHPVARLVPSAHSDAVLQSTDGVLFYVHRVILAEASSNGFGSALLHDAAAPIAVNDDSAVLNIILHAVYDLPSAHFSPSFRTLVDAVDRMEPVYGVAPTRFILPATSSDLFAQLYSHAPHRPIDVYMLAAHHGLEDLAVLVSGHLLSFKLETLTDDMTERMGAMYLKRLVFLHLDRLKRLREILLVLPPPHEGGGCKADPQRAWALAAAELVNDAKPDLSPHLLAASMKGFAGDIPCARCMHNFQTRLAEAAELWSNVPASI